MSVWSGPIIWLVLAIIFAVAEGLTVQLVSIWFTIGAVGAAITALLGGSIYTQFIIFVVISAVLVILTRPLMKQLTSSKRHHTNADQVIGQTGLVTTAIDNINRKGRVKVMGQDWAAISKNENCIEAGVQVTILAIEGVKLIVAPAE